MNKNQKKAIDSLISRLQKDIDRCNDIINRSFAIKGFSKRASVEKKLKEPILYTLKGIAYLRDTTESDDLSVISSRTFNYNQIEEEINRKVPILKGCKNRQCFCTGECKEVIGYRDKLPEEM